MELSKKNLSLIRESIKCYIETLDAEINRIKSMDRPSIWDIAAPALLAKLDECRYLLEDIDLMMNKD